MNRHDIRIVPWFSMAEWDYVYKLVFSQELEHQEKGYRRLLVWKARQRDLPAFVECTLCLLEAHIADQRLQENIACGNYNIRYVRHLKAIYSNAITRFLNLLSSLFLSTNNTLFQVALKLNIPSWVVALRHECAHGNSLSSLDMLRAATKFLLGWLHEQCWNSDVMDMRDLDPGEMTEEEEDIREKVTTFRKLLDLWISLKVYQKSKVKYMDELEDQEVSATFKSFCNVPGGQTVKEPEMNTISGSHDDIITLSSSEEEEEVASERIKVKTAADQVMKKLADFLQKNNNENIIGELNEVIDKDILQKDIFMLDPQLYGCIEKIKALPEAALKMWEDFLKVIPSGMVFFLLEKLININGENNSETSRRRKAAALWIATLCSGLLKVKKVLQLIDFKNTDQDGQPTRVQNLTSKISVKVPVGKKTSVKKMFAMVCETDKNLKKAPELHLEVSVDNVKFLQLFRKALTTPNENTKFFIESMMNVLEPRFPEQMKVNILNILQIYAGPTEMCDLFLTDSATTTYTVEDLLKDSSTQDMELDVTEETNTSLPVKSRWKLDDSVDWSKWPIGICPSQNNDPFVNLDVPDTVQWVITPAAIDKLNSIDNRLELAHKEVDWNLLRKKRKRKADTVLLA